MEGSPLVPVSVPWRVTAVSLTHLLDRSDSAAVPGALWRPLPNSSPGTRAFD